MSNSTRPRRPLIEALEPRLLFSATADIAVFDDVNHAVDSLTQAANNLDLTQVYPDLIAQRQAVSSETTASDITKNAADSADTPLVLPANTSQEADTHSLVFVDVHVADYQRLVEDILNNPDNKNIEIIYLDVNQDGIAQITQSLSLYSNVTSIHLISHGIPGELQVGNSVLNGNTIAQFKNEFSSWQKNLTSDADILIYGCDLAANDAGVQLLEQLNRFTGADVAASTNLTGTVAYADWVLEKNIGSVETASLITAQQQLGWSGALADVTYINTGSGGNNYALIPGDFAGQSFQYTSTVSIDRISLEINKTTGAAAQNLYLEIRDNYNGTLIGSATVSSSALSNGVQWVNFDFPEVSLTAYQVYWVRLSTSGSDQLIAATYHNTSVFNNGTFFNNAGGAERDLSFAITNVGAVNSAPSVAITPTTYTATEQLALNLHGTGISVADIDGDNLTVTLAATGGTSQITANAGTTGVGITSGNGTNSLVVNGTIAQLNNFFNGSSGAALTYRAATDTPAANSTLTITASDGVLTSNDTATINITAVNDAPVNTVPSTQNTTEDTALIFSTGYGNRISIADADAASSTVRTSISVTNGVLSLAGVTGLTFTAGDGSSNSTMTFTGTVANINAALATITYLPTANFNGSDTFTIITNDLGNTGTGGARSDSDSFTINIAAANDAPVTAHPIPNQNAPINVAFSFTVAGNAFSDIDTGNTLTYTAQLSGGGALPSWLNFNAATRTFSGTPTNLDVGTLNIDVTASDGNGGTVTDTFAIITSSNVDTNYIDTGANNTDLFVSTTQQVGQSFSYNSGNGTYLANEISLFITASGAAPQTVTVELLDAWSGVVLGSDSVSSTALSRNDKEWYSFGFNNVTLTDNTTYYIKVSSTGTDGAIKLGYLGDVVTPGNVLVNGTDDLAKDLSFKVGYENGSNLAPAVANSITDQTTNSNAAFNYTVPANTFADADPVDTITYRANLVGRSDLDWLTFDTTTRQFGGMPGLAQIGTWNVEVIATDNHGASTSEFFDVVVANPNTVPTPIPDQNVSEGSAYSFQFTAFNNGNGDALTYSATQANGDPLPTWFNFDPLTRTFSGTADDNDVNIKNIRVTATDPNGGSVSDTFTLTVSDVQEAPYVLNPIADQTATGSIPFTFTFAPDVAADEDIGDSITYSVQLAGGGALPSWLTYDSLTRTFSGTPTNANVGTLSIDVIATDTSSNTVTDTFDIVISTGNTPPVNTVPATQYTNEDVPLVFSAGNGNQLQITDVDAGSGNVRVTLSVLSGEFNLASVAGLSFISGDGTNDATMDFTGTVANINNALATLTYRSATNYFGANTFTIVTNDLGNTGPGGAYSDTDTVSINVLSVNDSPTAANVIANQNATEDSAFSFQFASNTFTDVDVGDTLTYSAQLNGGGALPSWLTFNAATRTFSGTPTNADVGTLSIDVIANDGHNGTVTDTFNIVIANANDAPTVANAIPNQNATEDSALNFQFASNTFSDADIGNTLTYTAQMNGGGALPSWLTFSSATRTFSGTPTNADVGTITLDVIANDGNNGTVTDTFDIVIANANDTPTVANGIPNQTTAEDSAPNFQFANNTFSDVDVGDSLTYTAQLNNGGALPAWLNFDSATRTFSGTPLHGNEGLYTIEITATDSQGQSATTNFVVNVSHVNQAPTSTGIPTLNTVRNSIGDTIDLFTAFADREDQDAQLIYSIVGNTNSTLVNQTVIDAQTGKLQLYYGENQFGSGQITVRATDGQGASIDTSFTVNVAFLNNVPVSTGIKNISVIQGSSPSSVNLSAIFSDLENGNNLQYSVISNSNPALLQSIQFNQQDHTSTINYNSAVWGETTIILRATDSDGGFIDSEFKITVLPESGPAQSIPIVVPPTVKDIELVVTNPDNTGDSTSGPSKSTDDTSWLGGSGGSPQNNVSIGDPLANNLIGYRGGDDALNLIVETQSNQTQEIFDRNRYDRIVQHTQVKKLMDPLIARPIVSSLISPGEGYSAADSEAFNAQLRKIRREMDNVIEDEQQLRTVVSGITLSLTTGILIWSLRASSLLLALMSMLPLWRGIDPLPILEEVKKRKKDLEKQRSDKKAEDQNAKEVGYLFDNANNSVKKAKEKS
jgi:VCBS repeat-containing protein